METENGMSFERKSCFPFHQPRSFAFTIPQNTLRRILLGLNCYSAQEGINRQGNLIDIISYLIGFLPIMADDIYIYMYIYIYIYIIGCFICLVLNIRFEMAIVIGC